MKESAKYLELARKIKKLCDSGEGGESANAIEMLNKLMKEHGITLDEMEGEAKDYHWFKYDKETSALLRQVVASVVGGGNLYGNKALKNHFGCECTASDALLIEAKFAFYSAKYKKELDIFYKAFVAANDIYPDGPGKNVDDLSPEEREEAMKVLRLSKSMDKHHFLKQIS